MCGQASKKHIAYSKSVQKSVGAENQQDSMVRCDAEFYRKESKRLSQIAAKTGLPENLIEGAVLEVWLKIARQWDSFAEPDGIRRLLALSGKMMHDTAVDLIRQRDRHPLASLDAQSGEPLDGGAAKRAILEEELGDLDALLAELRQQQPDNCWLLCEHFLEKRDYEELAAQTDWTVGAIRNRISRTLKELRRRASARRRDDENSP